MKTKRKQVLFLTLFAAMFIGGLIGVRSTPLSVDKQFNKFVTTSDGVKICYDVFEPRNNESSNKKAVILGHGVMVNKEVMRMIALELAKHNFVAVSFDFRGHGRSGGDFNFIAEDFDLDAIDHESGVSTSGFTSDEKLARDIAAVKEYYLGARGDIDMSDIGYVGYSMGGGAGFYACSQDNDFGAMVGLCPSPVYDYVNITHPKNLCVLHSKYDEAIDYGSILRVMENKTGVAAEQIAANITEDPVWEFDEGSFTDGSAARLYYNKYQEHFLAGWDAQYIRETRNWMLRALQGYNIEELPEGTIYPGMAISFAVQLIGIIGMIILGLYLVIPRISEGVERTDEPLIPPEIVQEQGYRGIILKAGVFIAVFSFPSMLLFLPFLLGHLVVTGFQLMLMFGPSFAVWLYMRWLLKKKLNHKHPMKALYKRMFGLTSRRNILIGFCLGFLIYGGVQLTFGYFFSIMPSAFDWLWVPFYLVPTVFIYSNFILFFQSLMQEKFIKSKGNTVLKSILNNFGINCLLSAFILFVPSLLLGNYFLAMFIIAVSGLHLISSVTATASYNATKDVFMVTLITSIVPCLMFATLSPIINILLFF